MKEVTDKPKTELSRKIARLSNLSIDKLKERWAAVLNTAPPGRCSKKLLVAGIAYQLQKQAFGGLRPEVIQQLERIAASAGKPGSPPTKQATTAMSGTVLIRDWQGTSHQVTLLEHGVMYRGENYRSLSQVARLITGTNWSGPLFFGLKSRSKEASGGSR